MTNEQILQQLMEAEDNAAACRELLPQWDVSQPFVLTVDNFKQYIKMHMWDYKDFNFEMECLVKKYLPAFMLDVFFDLKEFRSNPRNELTSTGRVFAKMSGFPMQTQDDKAFCQYEYSFRKYFDNPRLNK